MTKQSYKSLLEKYMNNTATEHELQLLEEYADEMLRKSSTEAFFNEEEKAVIKNELRDRIKIKKPANRTWLRVAASIAIVSSIALGLYFTNIFSSKTIAVSTGVGETKIVELADGSSITLNAQSTIEYPETFNEAERKISLKGEAVFDVAKDKNRAFIVDANGVETKVLGTVFNIKAQKKKKKVTVTLLEGLVEVNGLDKVYRLEPNQQATYYLKRVLASKNHINATEVLAWQQGNLFLNETSFAELAGIIKRQYGVSVSFKNEQLKQNTVTANFKQPNVETILKTICALKGLQFKKTSDNNYQIEESL
ncbi:MAG: FecR domain-containing protein [Bacteroidetes bacterium]|nr:FecR domain-containing protein [Bacteroidota bacterium]